MALRAGLFLLVLALAMLARSSSSLSFDDASLSALAGFDILPTRTSGSLGGTCDGNVVGDCIDEDEEGMMGSEFTRRVLARQRYISYGAMRANNVPCNKRGRSYYDCSRRGRANPYTRGCSKITRCGRYNF